MARLHESPNIDELLAILEELSIAVHSSTLAAAQAKFTERLLREQQNGNGAHVQTDDVLWTAKEAAPHCGVSPDYLYDHQDQLAFCVKLPATKTKSKNGDRKQHLRFSRNGIQKWIKQRAGR
jgi:hypothetical protein